EVASEEAGPLAHAEQAEVRCGLVVELVWRKAAPVVGYGELQLVGGEPHRYLQPVCLGVAERVAHGLLDDLEGAELDFRGEANRLPSDLQISMQVGLLVDVSKQPSQPAHPASRLQAT